MAQVVVSIDTSGEEMLRINFASMSKTEVKSDEKILVSRSVESMGRDDHFPKIARIKSGDR